MVVAAVPLLALALVYVYLARGTTSHRRGPLYQKYRQVRSRSRLFTDGPAAFDDYDAYGNPLYSDSVDDQDRYEGDTYESR